MTAINKPLAGRNIRVIVAALALAIAGATATLVATGTFEVPGTGVAPAEGSLQGDPAVNYLERSVNQADIVPATRTSPDAGAWYGSAFAGEQTQVGWTDGYGEAFSARTDAD